MNEKKKIIFDTDIGDDDAIALSAALMCESLDIIGITTVQGNLPIDMSTENALAVVSHFKKDIPVFKGCRKPLVRTLNKGRDYTTLMETVKMVVDGKLIRIHHEELPIPKSERVIEKTHACSFIVDTLRNAKEKIDIVAIGPLTNIATALIMDADIISNIGTIYIMGGGLYIGNRTPIAEANFYDDPEAAEIVLTSGANIMLAPIEVCESTVTYSRADMEAIRAINTPTAEFLYQTLDGYTEREKILFHGEDRCCVYDFAAVAPLIDPSVIEEEHLQIAHVDFYGGMADGQLVVDRRSFAGFDKTAHILYKENEAKVKGLLLNLLKKHN